MKCSTSVDSFVNLELFARETKEGKVLDRIPYVAKKGLDPLVSAGNHYARCHAVKG